MWFLVLPMVLRVDAYLMPHDDLILIMTGYSPDENDIYDYASGVLKFSRFLFDLFGCLKIFAFFSLLI